MRKIMLQSEVSRVIFFFLILIQKFMVKMHFILQSEVSRVIFFFLDTYTEVHG